MEKFTEARKPRGCPVTKEKVQEVVLPWEMNYFSPMLREEVLTVFSGNLDVAGYCNFSYTDDDDQSVI